MFTNLVNRKARVDDWHKIPWHDPDFSRRMLAFHLDQSNDLASRRQTIIDQQVDWMQRKVLHGQPARILDLGCGPGFYVRRFSDLGHSCKGIDFSPASIDYARTQHSDGDYVQDDLREANFGEGYDLVTLIYGELNAFAPDEAQTILRKAHDALKDGGKLLLEIHPYDVIYKIGEEGASWYTAQSGLFADEPFLCLSESSFVIDHAISHYYVYLADSGTMTHYTSMHQAYTDDEYRQMLSAFARVNFYPSLTGQVNEDDNLFVIVAEK